MTGRLRALVAAATLVVIGLAGALGAPASAVSPYHSSSTHWSHVLARGPVAVMWPTPATPAIPPELPDNGTQLLYGGGTNGVGVQLHPAVYLVFWGSQWDKQDPYAAYEQRFFQGLYGHGDDWTTIQRQYCNGTQPGSTVCAPSMPHIGAPIGRGVLKGVWFDDAALAVPTDLLGLGVNPVDSVSAEAIRAAQHFGNTTAARNRNAQYIINEPTKFDSPAYGVVFCAYHSSVAAPGIGRVVYADMPYVLDPDVPAQGGVNCGQNAVNPGAAGRFDGVSIVAGHEFVESMTDPYPDTGWADSSGQESADKCAWIMSGPGAMGNLKLPTGRFAVQSMWSNVLDNYQGGCVLHQHH